MADDRFHSLPGPSKIGDQLLERSCRLKLDLLFIKKGSPLAEDSEASFVEVDYELHGSARVELTGDSEGPRFLRELLTAFRTVERVDDKEDGDDFAKGAPPQ